MPVPVVPFTDERLPNGLRLIISEDHLVPVVAVNVWYDVGSKHEQEGRTGFAHLFEHVMFQGSRHVAKAEHIALVQAAGGTMNGTTWLDRTNYFETMPSHQLELAIWLEADRLATLLDALSQENLDNQRAVVKNEKRNSYDNQPYGTWQEKLLGHLYPPEHPYHHPTIGSMEDLDAATRRGRERLLPDLVRAQQRGPLDRRRRRSRPGAGLGRAVLRADPGQPGHPAVRGGSAAHDARRRAPRDGRGPGSAAADLRRLAGAGDRRRSPLRAGDRGPGPGRRQGKPPPPPPRARGPDRPGRHHLPAPVRLRPVGLHGLGDRPARRDDRGRRGRLPRRGRPPRRRGRDRRRAGPGEGPDRDRRARVAPAGRRARRPAEHVRDPPRRARRDQPPARALPCRGPDGRARGVCGAARRAQPGRPHLRAGRRCGRRRRRGREDAGDGDAAGDGPGGPLEDDTTEGEA